MPAATAHDVVRTRQLIVEDFLGFQEVLPPVSGTTEYKWVLDQGDGILKLSVNGGAYINVANAGGFLAVAAGASLNAAYNAGGPGVGRTILANFGSVLVNKSSVDANSAIETNVTAGTGPGYLTNGFVTMTPPFVAPAVSAVGTGRYYYDPVMNTFLASVNGGAYTILVPTPTSLQNAYTGGSVIDTTAVGGAVTVTNTTAALISLLSLTQNAAVGNTTLTVAAGTGLSARFTGGAGISCPGSGVLTERFGSAATAGPGVQSTAVGAAALAGTLGAPFTNCTAVGCTANASGSVGTGGATAIGFGTVARSNATAVGAGATCPAGLSDGDIAIGAAATCSDSGGGVAIGQASSISAAGSESIAIGRSATVTNINVVAIGGSMTVSAANGVAIGRGITLSGMNSVAIGFAANVGASTECVAIGNMANATGGVTESVAIGGIAAATTANAGNNRCVAVGAGAQAISVDSVAIGRRADATGAGQHVAVGSGASCAGGTNSVAVGFTALCAAAANNSVAIGFGAGCAPPQSIAIGSGALVSVVTGTGAIAIGQAAASGGSAPGVAIGQTANATSPIAGSCVAIGFNAQANPAVAPGSVAVGGSSLATGSACVAVGLGAQATGVVGFNTAVGQAALATSAGGSGTAIGAGAVAGTGGSALGANATATGTSSIAIGNVAVALGLNSIAIGSGVRVVAANTAVISNVASAAANTQNTIFGLGITLGAFTNITLLGHGATASAASTTVLGQGATASGTGAVAVGQAASASGTNGIAIGQIATASATNAIAIGRAANARQVRTIAIGDGAFVPLGAIDSIVLGNTILAAVNANVIAIGNAMTVNALAPIDSVQIGNASTSGTATAFVIVGHGAGVGGTDSVAIGAAASVGIAGSSVAVGRSATADLSSVAVGRLAAAGGGASTFCTAVGQSAVAGGVGGVAIGSTATTGASAASSTAVGAGATASGLSSTALGAAATTAGFISSVALGAGATCTVANQFMVGAAGAAITEMWLGNGASSVLPSDTSIRTTASAAAAVRGSDLAIFPGGGGAGARNGWIALGGAVARSGMDAYESVGFGSITTVAAASFPYTQVETDFSILGNAAGLGNVLNLLSTTGRQGRMVCIRKTTGGGVSIVITPAAGDTVDGAATLTLTGAPTRQCVWLQADDVNNDWTVLANRN